MKNDENGISHEFYDRNIASKLGFERPEVLAVGKRGFDAAVIQTGQEKVTAVASAPLFIEPGFGWDKAAWPSFHQAVSDYCTSGLPPEYVAVNLSAPSTVPDEDLAKVWHTIHFESKKHQISVVSASVERQDDRNSLPAGNATVFGSGHLGNYVSPAMSKPGDAVIVTKTVGLESAAILARLFENHVEKNAGEYNLKMGRKLFYKMTTVQESLEAAKFGLRDKGISSMHNSSGGILNALYEIAEASGNGISVDMERLPLYDEVKAVCELFSLDPLKTAGGGSLVLTAKKDLADDFVRILIGNGIDATIVGEIRDPDEGRKVISGGKEEILKPVRKDDYRTAVRIARENKLD